VAVEGGEHERVGALERIDCLVMALKSVIEVLHMRHDIQRDFSSVLGFDKELSDLFVDALVVPGLIVAVRTSVHVDVLKVVVLLEEPAERLAIEPTHVRVVVDCEALFF